MTEVNIVHIQSVHQHLQKPGSCGVVVPNTMAKVLCFSFSFLSENQDFFLDRIDKDGSIY